MDDDLKFLNDNILTIIEYKIYSKESNTSPPAKLMLQNFLASDNVKEHFRLIRRTASKDNYYSLEFGDSYLNLFIFEKEIKVLKAMVRKRKVDILSGYK